MLSLDNRELNQNSNKSLGRQSNSKIALNKQFFETMQSKPVANAQDHNGRSTLQGKHSNHIEVSSAHNTNHGANSKQQKDINRLKEKF